jgi:imidazolonepropionase-like amidohydrolase
MIRAVGATGGTWAPPAPYPSAPDAVINGPDDARRAVRLQHAHGVDIVEVTVSGLVGNSNGTTSMATTSWSLDEMTAAVDEAHALGHRISANCYVDESVERCVQAGFDVIEHGCLITERGMKVLADSGTFIVAHTRTAAEAMGWADRVGTIAPGRLADLLVVDGDPLADIGILRDRTKLLVVMQDGVAHRSSYPEVPA